MAYVPEKFYVVKVLSPNDAALAQALMEHLKVVPVFKDHASTLGRVSEMKPKLDYITSYVNDDDLAICIDVAAKRYTNSIELLNNATDDFIAGWRAASTRVAKPPKKAKRVKSK